MRHLALGLVAVSGSLALAGCGGSSRVTPTADVSSPARDTRAWRPGEALALVLEPPIDRVRPVDDAFLRSTDSYRARIERAEELAPSLTVIERDDAAIHRTWFLNGHDPVVMHIDLESDGIVDQAQYFGPEGLFAVVHHFAGGRRTQRIYWPPGEARIVEIRDAEPPFAGIWWRSTDDPFPAPQESNP